MQKRDACETSFQRWRGGDEVKAEMKGFPLTGETPLPKTKRKEGRKDRVGLHRSAGNRILWKFPCEVESKVSCWRARRGIRVWGVGAGKREVKVWEN